MRGIYVFSVGLVLAFCQGPWGMAQEMISVKPDRPVICYHSYENRLDHVGASDKFQRLRQSGTGRTKTATIEVEYVNFPLDNLAKSAFEYAVEIWESELTSSVPIRIRAEWRVLGSGVLGQAIWGSAHANFGGEQHMNTFYPVALAEKIAGRELNDSSEPDIVASFSSSAAWYFKTDGETPAGKMDLVTIVLHEIAHGLGFSDTYDVKGSQGSVGLSTGETSVPFIFDLFVENRANQNLLRNFQSPSAVLATELQSADLFFNSPLSLDALEGIRPKLYAPEKFNNGSSISHLDERTFDAEQDANRLMTPQISFAESIHRPGSVLIAMLADMGWVTTRIEHEPLKDTERKDGQPYVITARINSDNGYKPATVKIHYSSDGANFSVANMMLTGSPDEYRFSLPGKTTNWGYAYFISVDDVDNRTFTSPGKIQSVGKAPEQGTHFFNIGPDLTEPEILHNPVEFISDVDNGLLLVAEVTDNLGLKEVLVEYKFDDGAVATVVMANVIGANEYKVKIDLPQLAIGDEVQYRLVARDRAQQENITILPADGFFIARVTGIMPVQDGYSNDFNEPTADFFGGSFSISTPAGFEDGAIHSDHPYKNGAGPNQESSYVYQLQVPIRINEIDPVIKFEEIVLVEPGEQTSDFGEDGFYDYVVVEGSVDGGASWKAFADGYDSRDQGVWLTRYNADVSGDDSQSKGDSSLFRPRTINMTESGDFIPGNEVLIRFRLFADQLAHGWGWAIDNLSIQAPVTGNEQPQSSALAVYPIPSRTELIVDFSDPYAGPVNIYIQDALGRLVYTESVAKNSPILKRIDIGSFKDGVYVLRLKSGENFFTLKFLKVSD